MSLAKMSSCDTLPVCFAIGIQALESVFVKKPHTNGRDKPIFRVGYIFLKSAGAVSSNQSFLILRQDNRIVFRVQEQIVRYVRLGRVDPSQVDQSKEHLLRRS